MPIMHKETKDNYTVISNDVFYDSTLSMKAKGLLCQMLSLPDNWQFSIEGLTNLVKDGKEAVRNAVLELESAGYVRREEVRVDGRYTSIEYFVHDYIPETSNPMSEEPMSENPTSVNPMSKNRPQLNTNTLNTKESSTKKSNTKKSKTNSLEVLVLDLPEELQDVMRAFIDMRKQMKSPMTEYALKLLIRKMMKLANNNTDMCREILEQSITNGWKSVYPLSGNRNSQKAGRSDWIDDL
jgi:hypothetical protein